MPLSLRTPPAPPVLWQMRGVLLPVFPGGLSALGILRADVAQDFSRTVLLPLKNPALAFREAQQVLRKLRRDGENALQREGFPRKQQRFEYRLDLRYIGQAYDLSIPATHDFVSAFHHARFSCGGVCGGLIGINSLL